MLINNKKENAMSNATETGTMSSLIEKRVVLVRFPSSQTKSDQDYAFLTDIPDLEKGDNVVADTRYGLRVCVVSRVLGISKSDRDKACSWIIQRVDYAAHQEKMRRYELVAEIEATIEEEMANRNRMAYFLEAAQHNPRIGALVEQLQGLLPQNMVTGPAETVAVEGKPVGPLNNSDIEA